MGKIYKITKLEELSEEEETALDRAEKAMTDSPYNPYSGYSVGACVLTEDGKFFKGANVENVAFGSSICAERSALMHANAEGHGDKVVAIAVITQSKEGPTIHISDSAPCGECRQAIMEASRRSGHNIKIIMSTTNKAKIAVTTINELLPLSFNPKIENDSKIATSNLC